MDDRAITRAQSSNKTNNAQLKDRPVEKQRMAYDAALARDAQRKTSSPQLKLDAKLGKRTFSDVASSLSVACDSSSSSAPGGSMLEPLPNKAATTTGLASADSSRASSSSASIKTQLSAVQDSCSSGLSDVVSKPLSQSACADGGVGVGDSPNSSANFGSDDISSASLVDADEIESDSKTQLFTNIPVQSFMHSEASEAEISAAKSRFLMMTSRFEELLISQNPDKETIILFEKALDRSEKTYQTLFNNALELRRMAIQSQPAPVAAQQIIRLEAPKNYFPDQKSLEVPPVLKALGEYQPELDKKGAEARLKYTFATMEKYHNSLTEESRNRQFPQLLMKLFKNSTAKMHKEVLESKTLSCEGLKDYLLRLYSLTDTFVDRKKIFDQLEFWPQHEACTTYQARVLESVADYYGINFDPDCQVVAAHVLQTNPPPVFNEIMKLMTDARRTMQIRFFGVGIR